MSVPRNVTPAIGNTLKDWRAICRLGRIDAQFRARSRTMHALITAMTPLREWEALRIAKRVQSTTVHPQPVFIIGHWRSGTTFVHNVLSSDPQFGVLTNLQALFPHACCTNPVIPFWAKHRMPKTRPMDSMVIGLRTPQEDELALMNMGVYSLYHMWAFPREISNIYDHTITLSDPAHCQTWKTTYERLLKKATFLGKGKRLVLKNPPHTGRIPVLLEMFPGARFIYVHRDPYAVYGSMKHMYEKIWPYFQLQEFSGAQLREAIFFVYERLIGAYNQTRSLIPDGQLVEISHESLIADAPATIRRIYDRLALGNFEDIAYAFDSSATYQPRPYDLSTSEREEISRRMSLS